MHLYFADISIYDRLSSRHKQQKLFLHVPPHSIWLLNHPAIQLHTSPFYSLTLTTYLFTDLPPNPLPALLLFFVCRISLWNNLPLDNVLIGCLTLCF